MSSGKRLKLPIGDAILKPAPVKIGGVTVQVLPNNVPGHKQRLLITFGRHTRRGVTHKMVVSLFKAACCVNDRW